MKVDKGLRPSSSQTEEVPQIVYGEKICSKRWNEKEMASFGELGRSRIF